MKNITNLFADWMNDTLVAECRDKDCIICQATEKAKEEGREATVEELDAAFKKARKAGVPITTMGGSSWLGD